MLRLPDFVQVMVKPPRVPFRVRALVFLARYLGTEAVLAGQADTATTSSITFAIRRRSSCVVFLLASYCPSISSFLSIEQRLLYP